MFDAASSSATASAGRITPAGLCNDFSLEMTAKDVDKLEEAAKLIPPGTQVSVTFLPNEDFPARVKAAAMLRRLGLEPVPHLSARRLKSQAELESYLTSLKNEANINSVFVIAGDPPQPEGPYEDALAIIKSGVLGKFGIKRVGISGYPEGHPDISPDKLWQAMRDKAATLKQLGHEYFMMTQFGFDADPIFGWLEQVRKEGVDVPVRIGVAGPASVKRLLAFAARCGVGASAKVMAKYGVSITKLLTTAGPDPIIKDLAKGLDPKVHGDVRLHFYPFGGLTPTAEWIRDFRAQAG